MCTGGRVVNYLDAMLDDPRHDVLFVGYQAEGTPGRAIQAARQGGQIEFLGRTLTIRAGVETIGGYSAHADADGLVDFVRGIPEPPREIRLVHGEAPARSALARRLQRLGDITVTSACETPYHRPNGQ
jgi:metallo-beta-lactamase family protein